MEKGISLSAKEKVVALLKASLPFSLVVCLSVPLWVFLGNPREWYGYEDQPIIGAQQLMIRIEQALGPDLGEITVAYLGASDMANLARAASRVAIHRKGFWAAYLPGYDKETDPGPIEDPNGRSTDFTLERLETWLDKTKQIPDVVMVGYGYWDSKSGVPPEEFEDNIREIVGMLERRGSRVGVMTSTHFGNMTELNKHEIGKYNGLIDIYNERLRMLAPRMSEEGHPVFLFDLALQAEQMKADGVNVEMDIAGTHFRKREPYERLAREIFKLIAEIESEELRQQAN